nr:AbrB/MazE/SpoVT family DNA-binding domain-containing protein [Bacilli bacterium]
MQTKARKWGNSVGIRIPNAFAEGTNIHDGTPVEIIFSPENKEIIIRRLNRPKKYSLKELLATMPQHQEELHGETDWGEPAGDEIW